MASNQTVALPPTGTYVDINNRFRNVNEPAWNFRFPPLTEFISGVGSYTVQVRRVVAQNFIPTIQAGKTDRISITVGGVNHLIILQEGHYNIDTLMAALNAAFGAFGAFVFTYDYVLQKLTLAVPAVTFSWNSPFVATGFESGRANLPSPFDRLLQMLGFYYIRNRTFTGPTTIVGDRSVNLIPTNSLAVYVNQNVSVLSSNPNNAQIIATIPMGEFDYGQTVTYEPPEPRTFSMSPQMLQDMTISVMDDYGTAVTVPDSTLLEIGFLLIATSKTYD